MTRLEKIKDFDASNEEILARLKPGELVQNYRLSSDSDPDDWSVEQAEARFYHAKFGAVLDPDRPRGHWRLDWRDRSAPNPTLLLSPDLFAHVTEALERS